MTVTNRAGNVVFTASRLRRPTSVPERQELVAGSARIRALGSGHPFSPVADTAGELVTVADLPRRVEIDPAAASATGSAGSTYGQVGAALHAAGWALPKHRVAAAHLGRRGLRDRHPRLRPRQRGAGRRSRSICGHASPTRCG